MFYLFCCWYSNFIQDMLIFNWFYSHKSIQSNVKFWLPVSWWDLSLRDQWPAGISWNANSWAGGGTSQLCWVVASRRWRDNWHQLKHRKLHLNLRNNVFPERVVRHWTRFPCETGFGIFTLNQNSAESFPLEPSCPGPAFSCGWNCTISRGTFVLKVLWIQL